MLTAYFIIVIFLDIDLFRVLYLFQLTRGVSYTLVKLGERVVFGVIFSCCDVNGTPKIPSAPLRFDESDCQNHMFSSSEHIQQLLLLIHPEERPDPERQTPPPLDAELERVDRIDVVYVAQTHEVHLRVPTV